MPRTIKEKRAEFMDWLTTNLDLLDPSGTASKSYHDQLDPLSDSKFASWAESFFANEKANLYVEIVEYERDLTMENIERTAANMKVPLFEYVINPDQTGDPDMAPMTPEPVPVGYIHEKRMPQTQMKKSTGSINIEKRNPKTGQVIGEDKNARNSDVETFSLVAMGADWALREFMGPRADDMKAKNQFYNAISKNGYVSLENDVSSDPTEKRALNAMDAYFAMQGFRTNLVAPKEIIPGPDYKPSKST